MKQRFTVKGMTCSACSAAVERAVNGMKGVSEAAVNLLSNSMTVVYDEKVTNGKAITEAVKKAGYEAFLYNQAKEAKPKQNIAEEEIKELKTRVITSFLFLAPLMYISMGHMLGLPVPGFLHGAHNAVAFAFTQFLLTLPIVYINRKYYRVGFKTLAARSPNMDSLIAIGSGAALVYGVFIIYKIGADLGAGNMELVAAHAMNLYFESAAMILTLITLGKYFEAKSKGRTSQAISKLIDLSPKTAHVIRDEIELEIPVEEVEIGDIVVVRPGGRIPVDGVIISGDTVVDESALTGESMPAEKTKGDRILTASINKTGYIKFKAEKVGSDTTLAQIIQLVEEAASSKAPIAKLADKVSGVFVPVVIAIAVLSVIVWLLLGQGAEFALSIGISVLVISCPCALGLATPVAIMVATGKGANLGILIKSAGALETAHKINTIVFDKTGTLTEGKPKVTDIITAKGFDDRELLGIAAAIEKPSEHPLSKAVTEAAEQLGIKAEAAESFKAIPGRGIAAKVGEETYLAGNSELMHEYNIFTMDFDETAERLTGEGKTLLYFANEKGMLGIIAVADVLKSTSKKAVKALNKLSIDTVMLTGDNSRTAGTIGKEAGISNIIAEVMPGDKEKAVAKIQGEGHVTAMVGDGINDAPALARADVGIAIGAGTDIAIESADIILMRSDLLDAVTAIELSRATIKNIKQNLFWAFFYNTVGIPIAAGVFYYAFGLRLNPMLAAAAMSLSSVCVVTNALRLRFFEAKH